MKLIFPAGVSVFTDQTGVAYMPDANGMLDIGSADPIPFLNAGFVSLPENNGSTSNRPTTGLSTGLMFFDTTLNKPIWRNAANSGWVDATGIAA